MLFIPFFVRRVKYYLPFPVNFRSYLFACGKMCASELLNRSLTLITMLHLLFYLNITIIVMFHNELDKRCVSVLQPKHKACVECFLWKLSSRRDIGMFCAHQSYANHITAVSLTNHTSSITK